MTDTLVAASPLSWDNALRVLRGRLHVAPALTEEVVAEVCRGLRIPTSAFPTDTEAAPLRLVRGASEFLRRISAFLPVVTLSNVVCVEADLNRLSSVLGSSVVDHFPSCRIGYAKPDRRAFEAVAMYWGIRTSQILHVGDHWECDILGATAAGARAVWISGGRVRPGERGPAPSRIEVVTDLAAAGRHVCHLFSRRAQ
ncbi:MAG: HAD family hydrolase [Egibacteraceae bacterium]